MIYGLLKRGDNAPAERFRRGALVSERVSEDGAVAGIHGEVTVSKGFPPLS